ncbi:uncharacterized protein LOC141655398 [Silene latifolia]|uniref:uncharacterized protein LOC141655398 n=1 Tax=Silene latifolia TaxID=37657 RepID=UPI003D789087
MDLMKAYDFVILEVCAGAASAYNFPPSFSKLLMECITSASFSLSLNGELFGFFPGKRGLRQGDPVSPLKSYAYFSGVKTQLKQDILTISGFKEGTLPFKYLGVAITAGRLKKKDCAELVDKIVERIRSLGAQRLSYAGRLVLVNAVLTSMYTYWASMFVLPKGVLTKVDAICRSFLWEGKSEYSRVPLLSWAKICMPVKEGGLGIKQSGYWNKASIGKLVWWIAAHPDKLWDLIREGFDDGLWIIGSRGYTVKSCYDWLRDKNVQVDWHKAVWCRMALPKHSFIAWLISNGALQLKDKLARLQISQDDICCLCQSASETHHHLFEDCQFSRNLLQGASSGRVRSYAEECIACYQ